MTIHLPLWFGYVLAVLGSLWALASVVANFFAALPDDTIANIRKESPRIGNLVLACHHVGLVFWPMVKALWGAIVTGVKVPFVIGAMLVLAIACSSCSAPQNVNLSGWQVYVQIGLQGTHEAIPGIERYVDANAHLTPAQKADVHRGFAAADASIPTAEADIAALSRFNDLPHQCRAHASVDLVATNAIGAIAVLDAAGEQIDPLAVNAITTLTALADALLPGCAAGAGPATARLRARLSHGGAR